MNKRGIDVIESRNNKGELQGLKFTDKKAWKLSKLPISKRGWNPRFSEVRSIICTIGKLTPPLAMNVAGIAKDIAVKVANLIYKQSKGMGY